MYREFLWVYKKKTTHKKIEKKKAVNKIYQRKKQKNQGTNRSLY